MDTTITVVRQEQYDKGPFPFGGRINEIIAALVAIRDSVPEEYRDVVECDISTDTYYDSTYAVFEARYSRPETEKEKATREHRIKQRAVEDMERAKAQYDRALRALNT